MSSLRVWAWDLESGSQAERTFSVRHWRDTQAGGYPLKEERDIYELLSNQASRRVRSCLEEVIDSDIIDDAVDRCRKTLKEHGGDSPLMDRIMKMADEFGKLGVTQAMLETRLNQKLQATSEGQLAGLRRVFKSLKDGIGRVEDFFKPEMTMEKPKFNAPPPACLPPEQGRQAPPGQAGTVASEPEIPQLVKLLEEYKLTEQDLIDYLHAVGSLSENIMTLTEMELSTAAALKKVWKQRADIPKRVIDWKASL